MSPILVRPVREQLEHDRVIRLLQAKYKRKFEVAINPGNEQSAPVGGSGAAAWYPDLVLQTADKNRKQQKFYRIFNEVPTVLMILIVVLAVVKPF